MMTTIMLGLNFAVTLKAWLMTSRVKDMEGAATAAPQTCRVENAEKMLMKMCCQRYRPPAFARYESQVFWWFFGPCTQVQGWGQCMWH